MSNRYPRIYKMLKEAGHEPWGALLVLTEAKRKKRHALNWIRLLRRAKHY